MAPVPKARKSATLTIRCCYVGIDPGKSGGLVLLSPGNVEAVSMPQTERDIWEWFDELPQPPTSVSAVIEKVGGYLGEGSEAPGSAMFNFGWGYGGLRMALVAAGVPFEEIAPRTWQKALKISPRKKAGRKFTESKSQWKQRLRAHAQQLFPSQKVTLATADAMLIALYCKRQHEGSLG